MVKAVVGGNWGDEGKGKITDLLANKADIVVRFQGGANAGHTVINDYGKFVMHLLPSGVFNENTLNVIASNVAFDADIFFDENKLLNENGINPNISVSSRAQLLLPFHKAQDRLEETRLSKNSFGSTMSGIAPFYADKYAKKNIQIAELYCSDLYSKAKRIYEDKKIYFKAFYDSELDITLDEFISYLNQLKIKLSDYLCDCPYLLNNAMKENKEILLEGQLGALRDIDSGIYPYVTSSFPLAGFGSVGTGIPPYEIKRIITVVKSYSTCIGAGDFVCEIFGNDAETLRKSGGDNGEYGATTGRPRRVGYLDIVATKYGCMLQGTTEIALSLLDVLGCLDAIPVCVGYSIDGEITNNFPLPYLLKKAKPVYKYLPSWKCDITNITDFEALPKEAKDFVDFVERELEIPVTLISNGPKRNQILYRKSKLKD
ncbi:MAG: adenylosuccinate synthase [Clostridiales bacterium]|nr:adenylosuccinate synthase [Clostridiales bacterium]